MIQERSEIDKRKTFVSIYHKNYTTHHNPWTWKKGRVWGSDFTNLKSHKNPDLQFTDQLFLTDQFPISPWLWNHKIQFLNESCKILSLKQRQLPQNSQGWHKRLQLWQAKKNDNQQTPKYPKKKTSWIDFYRQKPKSRIDFSISTTQSRPLRYWLICKP